KGLTVNQETMAVGEHRSRWLTWCGCRWWLATARAAGDGGVRLALVVPAGGVKIDVWQPASGLRFKKLIAVVLLGVDKN
ncbi:hypothetical protein Dimus_026598, partial [Dionaea muscipula]